MKDVIIIGAGASGLICGIEAARRGNSVCILEQKEKAGKKLYATGNGRCNLANRRLSLSNYHCVSNAYDIETMEQTILTEDTPEDLISYFAGLGVAVTERDGYLYPRSGQASTVVQALEQSFRLAGGCLRCGETVKAIKKQNDVFLIDTPERRYQAKKVVLATGGCANPKLGSDGSGYRLAKQLGHTVTICAASLCGIHCKEPEWHKLQGVRARGTVSIWNRNNKLFEDTGEIQFTKYGVSGIVIFNLSRYASLYFASGGRSLKSPIWISMNLIPDDTPEGLHRELLELKKTCGDRSCYDILHGYLPDKLADYILNIEHLDTNRAWNTISESAIQGLENRCRNLKVIITGVNDFDQAQVTAGGVLLSEVHFDTMESKKCAGLYLTGEVLDVDADCGGYNLMWAWSTGRRAGEQFKTCGEAFSQDLTQRI